MEKARHQTEQFRRLNAFISLTAERGDGEVVAVKDLIDVRGVPTTGGGIQLPLVPADSDAPVVAELRRHGCLVIGKTNLHEWAYGVTSNNPHFGPVLNPHDETRVAGGSSGGSAVAVATGMCDWAIGSDTGGSIRIPAAFCGIVGLKPTLGAISTERVIPLSRSLDTLGPMAADVATTWRAFELMTGRPLGDPELRHAPRLAVPAGWVFGLDEKTQETWSSVSESLPEIGFPDRQRLARAADTVLRWEASQFHGEWLRTHPERYGDDVRERLRVASQVTETDYGAAREELGRIREDAAAALDGWDALVLPATARVAPLLGDRDVVEPLTRFTRPFNATGQPVVCVPAPSRGLPVGVQLVGHHGREGDLLRVARVLESRWAALPRET